MDTALLQTGVFQQILDIGLAALVVGVSWKVLFPQDKNIEKRLALWKRELERLQRDLHLLVSEASTASRELNATLLEREQQLRSLLAQTEQSGAAASAQLTNTRQQTDTTESAEEFPNETWLEPRKQTTTEDAGTNNVTSLKDQLRVTKLRQAERKQQSMPSPAPVDIPEDGSVIDPVVYKIARRLLNAGQEIHVVARKLGLPVAEVRALAGTKSESPQAAHDPTQHIVRNVDAAGSAVRDLHALQADVASELPIDDIQDSVSIQRERTTL